jgi:hypothetical protein
MGEGRPLKFSSPIELEEKINQYFKECKEEGRRPFITELAVYLDTSRQTLCNYEERDEYFDAIKRAKERCEMELERNLIEGKVNPTGSIFNLKNNYGWKDKTEVESEHKGGMTIAWLQSPSTTPPVTGQKDSTTPPLAG